LTEGFWDAARRRELVIQRCDECGVLRHYPQPLCPTCASDRWSWTPVSGRGVVYSFSVAHRAFNPAWADRVPYAVATIELDEGVRMVSDLPDTDVERVSIGAQVEVFFEEIGEELVLPRFRLSGA
jgi:uncharacterized OB-fold protein